MNVQLIYYYFYVTTFFVRRKNLYLNLIPAAAARCSVRKEIFVCLEIKIDRYGKAKLKGCPTKGDHRSFL